MVSGRGGCASCRQQQAQVNRRSMPRLCQALPSSCQLPCLSTNPQWQGCMQSNDGSLQVGTGISMRRLGVLY
jgi:hypothetical protein